MISRQIHEGFRGGMKAAAGGTAPISRAITHPAFLTTAGGLLGAVGGVLGAGIGAGAGYGLTRLNRFIESRAIAGRAARGKAIVPGEKGAIQTLARSPYARGLAKTRLKSKAKGVARKAAPVAALGAGGAALAMSVTEENEAKAASARTYPISRALTSMPMAAGLGAVNAAAAVADPVAMGIGAGSQTLSNWLRRIIASRGLAGRATQGGQALYKGEKKVIERLINESPEFRREIYTQALRPQGF